MPSHHALLYSGRALSDTPLDVVVLRLETELVVITAPVLTIAMVREVIASAYVRPFERSTKTIVLEVGQIAPEAQQALLKVLEEPPLTTRFILVLPTFDNLLPTLRSRLYQVGESGVSVALVSHLYTQFATATVGERITLIADIAKAKDSTQFDELAEGLAASLRTASPSALTTRLHDWLLLLPKRGSAKKMLWEDIALVLPVASLP